MTAYQAKNELKLYPLQREQALVMLKDQREQNTIMKDFSVDDLRQSDIFKKQVDELGKPAEVANKILQGKIDKFVDSQILGGQDYICDDSKQKVRDYLKQQHAQVTAFTRFELGQKS